MLAIQSKQTDPDPNLDFGEIAQSYGYPFEEYSVTTSDGYILQLFRIPHGLSDTYIQGRPAVLLQHGIIDPSDSFIIRGPILSPGFYLANSGYDVWAANSRGSTYGRNHTTLDPDTDPDFYEFSFPDMVLDHQANIQFILNHTGLQTISYFGYNSGATSMFIGLIRQNQWFANRINLFISAGAVIRLDHMYSIALNRYGSPLPLETLRRNNITRFPPPDEYLMDASSLA